MRAPVPGRPDQLASARSDPGAAGCSVHDSDTRPPVTPEIAHSTCGQIAAGAECTKTTPRVTTVHLRSLSNVLPQRGWLRDGLWSRTNRRSVTDRDTRLCRDHCSWDHCALCDA